MVTTADHSRYSILSEKAGLPLMQKSKVLHQPIGALRIGENSMPTIFARSLRKLPRAKDTIGSPPRFQVRLPTTGR